jgi:hypothetical protein
MRRKGLKICLFAIPFLCIFLSGKVRESNTVFVIFKTHLDVGFTDLPSKVEEQYFKHDFPAALDLIDTLKTINGGRDKYIWTVGTWILSEYLERASAPEKQRLEKAIARGEIVWNAMPFTIETETTTREILESMLMRFRKLDQKYGKTTLAAKMTDVPGHTRSIVSPLVKYGVKLMDIGLNRSTTLPKIAENPDFPDICRWQDVDGSTILLLRKKSYSHTIDLPEGNVLSVNVKGDNRGPHTLKQVQDILAGLRKQYPGKQIVVSDLNVVAGVLSSSEHLFPIFKGEIGDTWIHGFGSAPDRMAKVRALQRLYRKWILNRDIDPESEEAIRFATRLGLVSEHTWGVDCAIYLKNETPDKYNIEGFQANRNLKEFRFLESSWREIDNYVYQAVDLLPKKLQKEALKEIAVTKDIPKYKIKGINKPAEIADNGALQVNLAGNKVSAGLFTLQTFNFKDFRAWTLSMMTSTGAKGGMEGSEAVSKSVHPVIKKIETKNDAAGKRITAELMLKDAALDARIYPSKVYVDYRMSKGQYSVDIDFTIIDKPANRMAEVYWLSFVPEDIIGIIAEKLGSRVNVKDATPGGNGRMMAIDRYVDIQTAQGDFRVTSYDVPLVLIGDRENMSYRAPADISKGIHFCIFNNLWGVNYSMWWEGSQRFRFKLEKL